MSWSLGLDIGGRNLKAVAVTGDGTLLHRTSAPSHDATSPATNWVDLPQRVLAEFTHRYERAPLSIGICAPGLAAHDHRSIAHLPGKLPGLEGIDWTLALNAPAMVPVLNDAHAALLGEAWIGAARRRQHVVMLTLGTGVGGAVMVDGKLLRGAIGRAGHIGHLSLDPNGPVSIVGMPGAIEMLFGDCTVQTRSNGRFSTTAELVVAHRAGDRHATEIWQRSVRALACAIASCINLFDPEVVVLGGGIAQAGDTLFDPLTAQLDRIEWRPGGHRVPVVPATLGEWAGAIGAARNSIS